MTKILQLAVVFALSLFPIWPRFALAQQEKISDFVEHASAAYVVVERPGNILEKFDTLLFQDNKHIARAVEILIDERFSLTTLQCITETEGHWRDLRSLLAEVAEISVVIHSWDNAEGRSDPQFSIAISASDESGERIEEAVSSLLSVFEDEIEDVFVGSASWLRNVSFEQVGNKLWISNSSQKTSELIGRIENSPSKPQRSLGKNRSYQNVLSLLEVDSVEPQVYGYMNPAGAPGFVATMIDSKLGSKVPPESFAGIGFWIAIQDDGNQIIVAPDGQYRSVIKWAWLAQHTVPASGFGKLINAFEPLGEIPQLPFPVTSLDAVAFDPADRLLAQREITQRIDDEDADTAGFAAEDALASLYGLRNYEPGFDFGSVAGASKATLHVTPMERGGEINQMLIHKVNDPVAMKKLVKLMVEHHNIGLPEAQKMVEIENDFGRLIGRSDSTIRQMLEQKQSSQSNAGQNSEAAISESGSLSREVMLGELEYFLNDQWMVRGDHVHVRQFLKAAHQKATKTQTHELLVAALGKNIDQDSIFKIVYQSNRLHEVGAAIETARLYQKHRDFAELQKTLRQEPNEFGLRIEVETEKDAVTAVRCLMFRAINEAMGTSVSLYSKSKRGMRIDGQVFSLN